MKPGCSALTTGRAPSFLLALAAALAGLVALQLWQVPTAAAVPPGTPSAGPSSTSTPSAGPSRAVVENLPGGRQQQHRAQTGSTTELSGSNATDPPQPRLTTRPAAAAAPALSVVVRADPVTATRTGQRITYSVVATNSGNQTLRGVVLAAVAPGLSALACAPVVQGGMLPVGTSTTCTASRTTDQAYLRTYGDRVRATARGVAPDGTSVTGSGSVRTTTSTEPPTATDDSVTIVSNALSVILPGSTNDSPGAPDGPPIDLPGARFPQQRDVIAILDHGTSAETERGFFRALRDGRVLFTVVGNEAIAWQQKVVYSTVDAAGHTVQSTLTVNRRPGPQAVEDTVQTTQGDPVTVDPLANDVPALTAAGQPAPFLISSLRFPAVQVVGDSIADDVPVDYADVAADGKSMTIAYQGTFTIEGSTIRFAPAPGFDGYLTVAYTVTDGLLDVVQGDLAVTVLSSQPALTDDAAVTTYGRPVSLPVVQNDTPGVAGHTLRFAGFVDLGHRFAGQTLITPEGTWSVDYLGVPGFQPANGFSGTAKARYAVDEVTATGTVLGFPKSYLGVYAGRHQANLSVTVRPGPSVQPLVLSTPHDVRGTVDPTSAATPSVHRDGTPGRFVPSRTVFTDVGQPTGSRVVDGGKTLLLAVGGKLGVSASTGQIAYTPAAGFVGFAGTVGFQLEDDTTGIFGTGETVSGRLSVVATGAIPVATDDDATTLPNVPVRLAGATNDDRGTSAAALSVDFPAVGQPSGSTVASGGRTLGVPGEGTWSVGSDGSVTFTPVRGFVEGASGVVYRVRSSAGTAMARLDATVQDPAVARPDSFIVGQLTDSDTELDVVANDVAGRNAAGTLGTIKRASLRFPTTGQPAGATVSADGTAIVVPAREGGSDLRWFLDTATGAVGLFEDQAFRGTTPTVRYDVQAISYDSVGKAVSTTISSTLKATYIGRDAVAADDEATVASGATATLYPNVNDVPSAYLGGLGQVEFHDDQLGNLPAGSTAGKHCYDNEVACQYYDYYVHVPGEGEWRTTFINTVTFTPEPQFVGTTSRVRYRESDVQGSVEAFLTVTVLPPGTVRPDVATTRQGVPVTVDVLADDTPARAADGSLQAPDLSLVRFAFDGQPAGTSVNAGRELVVPKEGRYVLDLATARLTFLPDPTFRGRASSVFVQVGTAIEKVQVTVVPVDPEANPDEATTTAGVPAVVAVLDNDDPGTLARPLVPSSVRLRSTPGLPAGSSVSSGGQLLTVTGRGTFAVAGDGTITFYALPGWTGTLPPVQYDVADANGIRTLSTVTVRVKS